MLQYRFGNASFLRIPFYLLMKFFINTLKVYKIHALQRTKYYSAIIRTLSCGMCIFWSFIFLCFWVEGKRANSDYHYVNLQSESFLPEPECYIYSYCQFTACDWYRYILG